MLDSNTLLWTSCGDTVIIAWNDHDGWLDKLYLEVRQQGPEREKVDHRQLASYISSIHRQAMPFWFNHALTRASPHKCRYKFVFLHAAFWLVWLVVVMLSSLQWSTQRWQEKNKLFLSLQSCHSKFLYNQDWKEPI